MPVSRRLSRSRGSRQPGLQVTLGQWSRDHPRCFRARAHLRLQVPTPPRATASPRPPAQSLQIPKAHRWP